jgi:hypothetical protein
MDNKIPTPVIAVLSHIIPALETHNGIDCLFSYAEAPGDPPEGSKPEKVHAWLRRINNESANPLSILGRIIEPIMEISDSEQSNSYRYGPSIAERKRFKNTLSLTIGKYNLVYHTGGKITLCASVPSYSLGELIKNRDIPSINAEYDRAIKNVISEPRESVSAACNILEAICKTYIEDENLEMPQKMDLASVWKVVRNNLGFEPGDIADEDLKKILSGMVSVVAGIGAFRTHVSSAHAQGRKIYRLQPRHARLAIHSAHTMAVFILETWDERIATKKSI